MSRRAIFVYFSHCEVLDFAGPLQALHETNAFTGNAYDVMHCGAGTPVVSEQGLQLAGLQPLPQPRESDVIFVPGFAVGACDPARKIGRWLRDAHRAGAQILATCTGAFVLARAGLLDGRTCTTHWKRTAELQKQFPRVHVVTGTLFVSDGNVTTSAGITAGIDMTLDFVEREHGPAIAANVAREMVVYIRRDGTHKQESMYLAYRSHIDPAIHTVQDFIAAHPARKCTLPELAAVANMSVRNLTRSFQKAAGISIGEYRTALRLEHAKTLLANPALTVEAVAERSGFTDARQLRRLWRKTHGVSPAASRS